MPKTAAVINKNNYQWKRQAKHWVENKLKIYIIINKTANLHIRL